MTSHVQCTCCRLVASCHTKASTAADAGEVVGLDIGCGANLIYPLLCAAQHGWRFVAADITDAAISGATANLAANPHLAHLIQVPSWLSRCKGLINGPRAPQSLPTACGSAVLAPSRSGP
jgi:23S rRNA A1618 N6-methylase RlmF